MRGGCVGGGGGMLERPFDPCVGEGGGVWGAMVRGHCWGVFRAGDNGVVVLRALESCGSLDRWGGMGVILYYVPPSNTWCTHGTLSRLVIPQPRAFFHRVPSSGTVDEGFLFASFPHPPSFLPLSFLLSASSLQLPPPSFLASSFLTSSFLVPTYVEVFLVP